MNTKTILIVFSAIILAIVVFAFIYRPILSVEFLILGLVPALRHGENQDVVKW